MNINKKFKNSQEYSICTDTNNIINLGIVENFNNHSPNITLPDDINFYPVQTDDYILLINKISNYTNVNVDQILLTNGSGKGLDLILHAFTTPETDILIPIPNYPGFIHSAELSNGNVKFINYTGIETDEMNLEDSIKTSDIIYFSSPNLPLGYSVNYDKMKNYIECYKNKLFIIDEAYFEYGKNISFVELTKLHNNLIVTRTFSKAFALAGARIGYIIAQTSIINILRIGYNAKDINNASIRYAYSVLSNKEYYLSNVVKDLQLIKFITHELSKIIKTNLTVYDFSTFNAPWFLIKTTNPEYVCNIMKKNGYLVRNKSDDIPNCVRISLCTKDHIIKVIDIIKTINTTYKHLYIDLDGTLRTDYKSLIPIQIRTLLNNLQKKYDITIITDNSYNFEDIQKYLTENEISCKLVSPINKLMNPENKKWFIFDECVYILQFPDITPDLMFYINKYNKIRVIETDISINTSELGLDYNIAIPHIGAFLQMLNNPTVEIIGKTNLIIHDFDLSLVIGDSYNDKAFAANNNFDFIKVANPTETIIHLNHLL